MLFLFRNQDIENNLNDVTTWRCIPMYITIYERLYESDIVVKVNLWEMAVT